MNVKVYTLNSFAKTAVGGNEAGVVIDANSLTESEMRKIAALIGFSETAFVLHSDIADYKVRFFTPKEEVDLCGHATIATFFTLATLGLIKSGQYRQETKAGVLGIEVKADYSIMMNQSLPTFSEILDKAEIADSLNIDLLQILQDLPVQIISTGLRDIIIPVTSLNALKSINPDYDKIKNISSKYNAVGYHVFTLESEEGANASCRNFAPLYDIPEESATGTSNGALGCYLYEHGVIDKSQTTTLIFEQGYSMNKPSEIRVIIGIKENEIIEVKVGGNAVNLNCVTLDI